MVQAKRVNVARSSLCGRVSWVLHALAVPQFAFTFGCDGSHPGSGTSKSDSSATSARPLPTSAALASRPAGRGEPAGTLSAPAPVPSASAAVARVRVAITPTKVEVQEQAMGTKLHFIAYSNPEVDEAATRAAVTRAVSEMRRLEGLLSEWKNESEVGQLNLHAGEWQKVSAETFNVIERGLAAGVASKGCFDITFQSLSKVWKFGSASEAEPKLPARAEVEALRRHVDYRQVTVDALGSRVKLGKQQQLGLGGIAKGYIVDAAVRVLRAAGVRDFLAQAGGDLYGAGKKPDGSAWLSGVQDPRGPQGTFFAVLDLTDHAFSTAGDYARSYIVAGKRYHHIIDPRTGYPATASRSVTVWAEDATTADAVDDAVFILGPEKGLELVRDTPGAGAVIVDAKNKVWVSERLQGKVKLLMPPTDGV